MLRKTIFCRHCMTGTTVPPCFTPLLFAQMQNLQGILWQMLFSRPTLHCPGRSPLFSFGCSGYAKTSGSIICENSQYCFLKNTSCPSKTITHRKAYIYKTRDTNACGKGSIPFHRLTGRLSHCTTFQSCLCRKWHSSWERVIRLSASG